MCVINRKKIIEQRVTLHVTRNIIFLLEKMLMSSWKCARESDRSSSHMLLNGFIDHVFRVILINLISGVRS